MLTIQAPSVQYTNLPTPNTFNFFWTLFMHYKGRISKAKTEKELNFIMDKLDMIEANLKAKLN